MLGTLARHGQQHGHQIRRIAEITNVGEWGGVSVGALYRELRSMEGEGLAISAGQLQAERERLIARGFIDPLAAAVMRRGEMHLEAEVSWHDEFAKVIARPPAGEPDAQP